MKHRYIYTLILSALILAGCNDWLDVSPRQEMRETSMYSNEEGFKSVLTGAYLAMSNSSLYAKNTSMYLPEMLAHHWTLPTDVNTDYSLGRFDYTYSGVESLLNTIWIEYYNVIAQLNNLMGAFDENVVHFNFSNDILIKGEALGLRAFLHFELLRYFGPVPSDAIAEQKTIPYVTSMTKDANLLVSLPWSQVIALIEKDFDAAEELLLVVDPIVTEVAQDDDWSHLYRENRFNYYAVLGMKARFYQWIGNKEKATLYARMVVDAKKKDDSPAFKLADETEYFPSDLYSNNLIMYSEMLFGVHNPKHQTVIQPLFTSKDASLRQTPTNINTAYEAGTHPDDMRNKPRRYWEEKSYQGGSTVNHFYKYTGNDLLVPALNVIPVLRLAEMYFILIENESLPTANTHFTTYRIARGMSSSVDNTLTDEQAVKSRLEKEYRKEFFGEGQMFFFYKRLKYADYTWPNNFTLPENAYVLPLPKGQLSFE